MCVCVRCVCDAGFGFWISIYMYLNAGLAGGRDPRLDQAHYLTRAARHRYRDIACEFEAGRVVSRPWFSDSGTSRSKHCR